MNENKLPYGKISDPKQLGELIRQVRKEQGITQEDLSALAGVRPRLIGEIERNKLAAEVGKVFRVLASLGLVLPIQPRTSKVSPAADRGWPTFAAVERLQLPDWQRRCPWKKIALFYGEDGSVRLAPFYDFLCTARTGSQDTRLIYKIQNQEEKVRCARIFQCS